MPIDLNHENLITLSQAARRLPGNPHISTLHRWRQKGLRGIRLETIRIGGRRYTSCEALSRFIKQTTAAADSKGRIQAPSSSSQRPPSRKHDANIERQLDAEGIGKPPDLSASQSKKEAP